MTTTPSPILIKPYRAIVGTGNPLIADAVVEERHNDEMVLTDQPVEVGSSITDHAYKLPRELDLNYGWSLGSSQNTTQNASFLKSLYQQFLTLQANRTLLTVYTGKCIYQNMLLRVIGVTTDKDNENILNIHLSLREIILAQTQTVNLTTQAQQALPQQTSPTVNQGTQNLQSAPTFNVTDAEKSMIGDILNPPQAVNP